MFSEFKTKIVTREEEQVRCPSPYHFHIGCLDLPADQHSLLKVSPELLCPCESYLAASESPGCH